MRGDTMTDEEFNKIMNNLQANGFAKAMSNLQEECVKQILAISFAYGASVTDTYRMFGKTFIKLADEVDAVFGNDSTNTETQEDK